MAQQRLAKRRMDLAFAALLSDDDAAVLEALARIGSEGDARSIRPLLCAYARADRPSVRQRIAALLNQVKAEGAAEALAEALDDPELLSARHAALSAFWSAGLDARAYLARFVDIAIEGSPQESLECLTIVQEQDAWPEKAARAGAARLREASRREQDAFKASVLSDMAEELNARLGKGGAEEQRN
ncbi:MAG: hypothetical protein ACK4L7_06900 [Flavobacteriales bacterium]